MNDLKEPWNSIVTILIIFSVVIIPMVLSLIWHIVTEIINIPRAKKNLEQIIQILDRIPEKKVTHFLSFYTSIAKQLEPGLKKESLLQNTFPQNNVSDYRTSNEEFIIKKIFIPD